VYAGAQIETRCADCLATGEEHLADARWLSQAGVAAGNPETTFDLLAHELWTDVARLHDEGAT
jgi:hypothetical protein